MTTIAARSGTVRPGAHPVEALAPVLSLARADLHVRTCGGDAAEIDAADLDPVHPVAIRALAGDG